MTHIEIIAVGRLKKESQYLQQGIDEYLKRLQPYAKVTLREVADEAPTATRPLEQVIEIEGKRILTCLEKASSCVVLSEHGSPIASPLFAQQLMGRLGFTSNPLNGGVPSTSRGPMMMVIGGAFGVSQQVLHRADWVLSLSPMTYPHQMVRLLLVEQLYRAFKIYRNEPYHK